MKKPTKAIWEKERIYEGKEMRAEWVKCCRILA